MSRAVDVEHAPPTPEAGPRRLAGPVAVVATAVAVTVVALVGRHLTEGGTVLHLLGGYVLRATPDVVFSPRVLLPVVVGAAGLLWGPALAARVRWVVLLAGSAVATAAWAVSLALTSGWDRLTAPIDSPYEYLVDVPRVGSVGELLATFNASVPADAAGTWSTHVSGHPPGALLTFVLLDRIGLPGPGWAAALCIAVGALAVPAVLVAVRAVGDEAAARVVAPFAVLAPTALWIATSADAVFAGVSAWGIALLAVAARLGGTRRGDVAAAAGGLLLGLALHLSFGLTALGLLAIGVVVVRWGRLGRAGVLRVLGVAAVGVLLVFGVFALGGYSWFEGFSVTGDRVRSGPSYADRPMTFFLFANLAAAAIAVGPAGVAGLASLRRRALAVLPLAALAGMLVSDVTGLVRGETERIWLPFTIWVVTAAGALPRGQRRFWLAAGVLLAIAVEVTVRTEW